MTVVDGFMTFRLLSNGSVRWGHIGRSARRQVAFDRLALIPRRWSAVVLAAAARTVIAVSASTVGASWWPSVAVSISIRASAPEATSSITTTETTPESWSAFKATTSTASSSSPAPVGRDLYSQLGSHKLFSIHGCDCFLSIFCIVKLYKCKAWLCGKVWRLEWLSSIGRKVKKVFHTGLKATQQLVILPYLANSTSKSSFLTFSRMLPTYTRLLGVRGDPAERLRSLPSESLSDVIFDLPKRKNNVNS